MDLERIEGSYSPSVLVKVHNTFVPVDVILDKSGLLLGLAPELLLRDALVAENLGPASLLADNHGRRTWSKMLNDKGINASTLEDISIDSGIQREVSLISDGKAVLNGVLINASCQAIFGPYTINDQLEILNENAPAILRECYWQMLLYCQSGTTATQVGVLALRGQHCPFTDLFSRKDVILS